MRKFLAKMQRDCRPCHPAWAEMSIVVRGMANARIAEQILEFLLDKEVLLL